MSAADGRWSFRKRHVKCDEAKPACKNCLSWRGGKGRCGGYDPPPPASAGTPTSRPQTPGPVPQARPASPDDRSILKELGLEPDLFVHDVEKAYFDDWIKVAIHKLGGGVFPSQLWMRTLPQLSRGDKSLRYGAIAIGGLIVMASQEASSTGTVVDGSSADAFRRSRHYETSVAYYCRALQLQGRSPQDDARSAWAVILASAIFACFEILRGDRNAALKHVSHSITLVNRLIRGFRGGFAVAAADDFAAAPKPALVEILRDFERLEIQCRSHINLRGDTAFASSSAPLTANVRLLAGHPSYTVGTYHHTLRYADYPYRSCSVADRFVDIDDARRHWELIQRRAWGIFPLVMSVVDEQQIDPSLDCLDLERRLNAVADDPRLLAFQREALGDIARLLAAFEPLLEHHRNHKDDNLPAYLQSVSLRIQHCVVSAFIRTPRYADLSSVKALTPEYALINSLTEELLEELSKNQDRDVRTFSMDTGMTWAVLVVSLSCRDRAVREDAIRILSRYPRHDGLWSTRAMLALAMRSQRLEEENEAAGGDEEEQWLRHRRREIGYGDDGKTVVVRFLKRNEETGRWELTSEVADYTVSEDNIEWTAQDVQGGVLLSDIR